MAPSTTHATDMTHQLWRVLLIEDNKSDILFVQDTLHKMHQQDSFIFTDVARMADALALLDRVAFDLILLDLNLLDITGIASIAALRAEPPNTPIIVYSGANDPLLQEEALLCGATDYLVKGMEYASLPNIINKTLLCEA